jgi:SAM-dependent methyltransferase
MTIVNKFYVAAEKYYEWIVFVGYSLFDKPLKKTKKLLFSGLKNETSLDPVLRARNQLKLLEIGPGFGGSFEFYPKGVLLTTVENNPWMESNFSKLQSEFPNIELEKSVICEAEDMSELADKSFDIVLGTQVMCCIQQPKLAMAEIRRVLRPGGKYYFMESVNYPNTNFKHYLQKVSFVFKNFNFEL